MPHPSVYRVYVGVSLVVDVQLRVVAAQAFVGSIGGRVGRIIPEVRVLQNPLGHVDPEAVDASLQPEPEDVEHRVLNQGIPPVEIRLFFKKAMEVVLAGVLVQLPGRAARDSQPIVGRAAVWGWITPDVPFTALITPRRTGFLKPWMFLGSMVGTKSTMICKSRAWASATSRSKSSSVPKM